MTADGTERGRGRSLGCSWSRTISSSVMSSRGTSRTRAWPSTSSPTDARDSSGPWRLFQDLVVLDLMLPGLNGIEVIKRLRQAAPIPVVMLTDRGSEEDRVAGLELGRTTSSRSRSRPGARGTGQGSATAHGGRSRSERRSRDGVRRADGRPRGARGGHRRQSPRFDGEGVRPARTLHREPWPSVSA